MADTLQGLASELRPAIEAILFERRFTYGIDMLRPFTIPTALIAYEMRNSSGKAGHGKILLEVEQESFNYLFARHLQFQITDRKQISDARGEFAGMTARMLVFTVKTLDAKSVPQNMIQTLGIMDVQKFYAFIVLQACVVKLTFDDHRYLLDKYEEFSLKILKWTVSVRNVVNKSF